MEAVESSDPGVTVISHVITVTVITVSRAAQETQEFCLVPLL